MKVNKVNFLQATFALHKRKLFKSRITVVLNDQVPKIKQREIQKGVTEK